MSWADRYARELGQRVERLGALKSRLELEVIGHLEDAAADHRECGLSPAEAEERAVRDFGSPDVIARQLLDDLGDAVVTMWTAVKPGRHQGPRPVSRRRRTRSDTRVRPRQQLCSSPY